ncbi:hypothetical protein ACVMIX_001906 [Rhizobium leguminosarum]
MELRKNGKHRHGGSPRTSWKNLVGDWDRPHSREQACFSPDAFRVDKYGLPVNRVDNVYGDRNLICTCPPMESYAETAEW